MDHKNIELGKTIKDVERRPRSGVVLSVRLTAEQADRIENAAHARSLTVSQAVRDAIEAYCNVFELQLPTTAAPTTSTADAEEIAIREPVKRGRAKRTNRGKVLTREDPLFDLIGIGASEVPGGVSGKKHKYLLEASRKQHR
jgi:predicted transcriptional regulator